MWPMNATSFRIWQFSAIFPDAACRPGPNFCLKKSFTKSFPTEMQKFCLKDAKVLLQRCKSSVSEMQKFATKIVFAKKRCESSINKDAKTFTLKDAKFLLQLMQKHQKISNSINSASQNSNKSLKVVSNSLN